MKIFLILAAALMMSACSDPNGATKALHDQGYKDIQITGWAIFGCDEKDQFSTGFVATGPSGNRVEGVVCSGWFKGKTVRTH